ncbi:MAG: PadR family transcriptional regulator [Anaerofustis sp.]
MTKHRGRHTSSYILLLLAEDESYGGALMNRLQTEMPHCFSDSADIYRCLAELEKDGSVTSRWETPDAGQPRKWYSVTEKGMHSLAEHAEDIRMRMENFVFFSDHYAKLNHKGDLS